VCPMLPVSLDSPSVFSLNIYQIRYSAECYWESCPDSHISIQYTYIRF
jgi:hypothetical protein